MGGDVGTDMRILLLTIILLTAVSAQQAPTPSKFADNFRHYASTPTTDYYLNEKDVKWRGSTVTFFGLIITPDRVSLHRFTADCEVFEYQQEGWSRYKGVTTAFKGVIEPAPQGTIIYAVLNKICGIRI